MNKLASRKFAHTVFAGLAMILAFTNRSAAANADLPTVPAVDLARYAGVWYEIARLPQWFERNCFGVTATYAPRDDGDLDVENSCHVGALDGRLKVATARAWATDASNSKLKVRFFWPFTGDYWVLALDASYAYALVGSPDRKSLWILSRTPVLSEDTVTELLEKGRDLGFPIDEMERTAQAGG